MNNSTPTFGQATNLRSGNQPPSRATVDHIVPATKPTRRQFIVNCSTLAFTAAVVPAALGAPLRGRTMALPLEPIGPGNFARQVNTNFIARPPHGAPTTLVLVEIRSLMASPAASPSAEDARNEKFSLLFAGPLTAPLAQNTYTFAHPQVGNFAIFIVPIGCLDPSQCYYEAIFNRPAWDPRRRQLRDDAE